jgi:hypothetical protein
MSKPKQSPYYLDQFLQENNIPESKLTFTCTGPMKKEIAFCCPININKLVKIYSKQSKKKQILQMKHLKN